MIAVASLSITLTRPVKAEPLSYPDTKKGDVVDTYFGAKVADPYRWLEDDRSEETADWVQRQNTLTFSELAKIPYRDVIAKQLSESINFKRISSPFKEGDYTYFYKNDGLQNHSVVYRQKQGQSEEVFLDPNTFSADGTTSLSELTFSEDGKIAAYSISEGGSDWRKIIVINADTKTKLEPELEDIKFSGTSWFGNDGFYYSSYDKPKGSELSAKTDQHKLYYHKLGTPQTDDKVVYGDTDSEKHRYVSAYVTEDNRYLVIVARVSTTGNRLFVKDLQQQDSSMVSVVEHYDSSTYVLDNIGSKLILETNLNAPNNKLVVVDVAKPQEVNWQDLIPESDNVLNATVGGGYIFAEYMQDAASVMKQFQYDGKLVREIKLPGTGSASSISGKAKQQELFYSFSNYKTPSTVYAFNAKSGKSSVYLESEADFKPDNYVSKQVFYASKDGTKVPMTITHKKGVTLNGKNPTMLYAYGGFNVSITPNFSMTNKVWFDAGGVLAVANIRGGGEYGKAWHDGGRLLNKQKVFDDFIAAGEYLIEQKVTSSDYLAIRGGSNGGLLVAAVIAQRPELFKVAIPQVGVLDMLRYHTFTSGAGWAYDYGTSEQNKEMFEYLKAYSPLHNLRKGTEYPATLVTTADHDDRVVPAHSFKFAAELQTQHSGDAPVLIRIDSNAGHGAGMSISKLVDLYADIYAFTLFNMGISLSEK